MSSGSLQAQILSNNPAATQQREKENRERLEEQRRLKERPAEQPMIDVPAVPELESEDDESSLKFALKTVEFSHSEWLSKSELDQLVAAYIGKNSSLAILNKLVNDINQYYRSRGIVTAQAILPPQKIAQGMVKITLVEGRIGKVIVTDNNSTASEYIATRVRLGADELIRIHELEKELARFNRVEDIQLRAQMEKGSEFGKTDIVLKAIEPQQHVVELFTSNTGTDETGETRGGISYTNNSVLGYRDRLSFSALGSSDSEGYVFSYNVAINRSGGRLGFNYFKDDIDIDSEFFSELDIKADSSTRSLDFTQPIYSDAGSALSFSTAIEESKSTSSIDDVVVQQSEVESVPLSLQWDQYFERDLLFINARFNRGREREFDERYFTSYRTNLTYLHMFDDQISFVTRLAGQYSNDDNLPGGQVFQIGGASSVRGYEEGLVSGDKGAFANIELQWDISSKLNSSLPFNITPLIFLDQGVVYPFLPDASLFAKKQYLGSVGTGLNFGFANMVSGSITIGFPVRKDNFEQDGSRVHFNVVYRPYVK
jgi:hemolysin activation/secretion protein